MATSPKRIKIAVLDSIDCSNDDEYEALEQIDACQSGIDVLNGKASMEILKLEKKYIELRKPLYNKRSELLKKIPNFWATALKNHPQVSSVLVEEEKECFHKLNKLEVEEFENIITGYRINFHFDENPYFKNKILTKELHLNSNDSEDNDCPLSTSTVIQWKMEGKNLFKKLLSKPINNKKKSNSKYKTFFDWFSNNSDPVNDKIAEVIKENLWPNPVQYYLAPDIKIESEDDDDEDEDIEDDGDENEDIEDDDESNEDDDETIEDDDEDIEDDDKGDDDDE